MNAAGAGSGISGYAVPKTGGETGKIAEFEVFLGPNANPKKPEGFKKANYLVFGLGPIVGGMYDYALVSDPSGLSLYVLARDVARFEQMYEMSVLKQLKDQGYSGFFAPHKTVQKNCNY